MNPLEAANEETNNARESFAKSQEAARIGDRFRNLWGLSFGRSFQSWIDGDDDHGFDSHLSELHGSCKEHLGDECFQRIEAFSYADFEGGDRIRACYLRQFIDIFKDLDSGNPAAEVLESIRDREGIETLDFHTQNFLDLLKSEKPEAFCDQCNERLWVADFGSGHCGCDGKPIEIETGHAADQRNGLTDPAAVEPSNKHKEWLIQSRVLKGQYIAGKPDKLIVKKARNWFSRDWKNKAKADGKRWHERFTDDERAEITALKSFFESKWKS